MWPLIAAFLDIALHRSGPDRLPSTPFLVVLLVIIDLPVNLLRLSFADSVSTTAYAAVFLDTAVFFAFVYGVLIFFRHKRRFRQTASALLGTDILINLIGLPVAAAAGAPSGSALDWIVTFASLALLLWWIDVSGYIIAKAIEQPYVVGIMFMIFYVVAALSLTSSPTQPAA